MIVIKCSADSSPLSDLVATRSCGLVPGFPARDARCARASYERGPVHARQQDDGRDEQARRRLSTARCEGDRHALDLQAGRRGWGGCHAFRKRIRSCVCARYEDASVEEYPWCASRCGQAQRDRGQREEGKEGWQRGHCYPGRICTFDPGRRGAASSRRWGRGCHAKEDPKLEQKGQSSSV